MGKVSSLAVVWSKETRIVVERQLNSDKYLKDGDVIRLTD